MTPTPEQIKAAMRRRLRALVADREKLFIAIGVGIWLLTLGAPVWAASATYALLILLRWDGPQQVETLVVRVRSSSRDDEGEGGDA